ncbi:MAG TPA: hypothetical protein VFQ07_12840 [Candidatus Polarisedimenticolia bacterium]|nr:hypothetical protein [Candidatus Polarisedimenticolia bacterium]
MRPEPAAGAGEPLAGRSAPRRGDRLLLGILLVLLAAATTLSPIRNYDYWWHLKTGALIVSEGRVPRVDPYSFTSSGTPWIDHEWLFQVLAWAGHTALGPHLLVLIKSALLVGIVLLAARLLVREGHGPAGAAILLMLALVGGAFRFDVRPELATLLLVPLAVDLAMRARRTGRTAPLAGVVALTAIGANLHVGILLVPALLWAATAATLVAARLARFRRGGRDADAAEPPGFPGRLAITALAATLAAGANPYGLKIYAVPFELRHLLQGLPWPNLEWVAPTWSTTPLFFVAAGLAAVVLVLGGRALDPIAAPALVLSLLIALQHVRNVGLFFLLLPWGLARPARHLVDRIKSSRLYHHGTGGEAVRPGFIIAAVLLLSGIPLLLWLPPQPVFGLGLDAGNEPRRAVDFLERQGISGPLYNDVRFGGYLIWRRFPAERVFIDSRNEIYGDLMRDIAASLKAPAAWNDFLDRHGIEAAFLRYNPTLQKVYYTAPDGSRRTGERAFSATYFPVAGWALVYWDDDVMVMLRRTPEHAEAIARLEYRALQPDDWRFLWASALIGKVPPGPILAEVDRKLREDPDCARAKELRERFAPFAAAAPETSLQPRGR